jgi:hypothetical protein
MALGATSSSYRFAVLPGEAWRSYRVPSGTFACVSPAKSFRLFPCRKVAARVEFVVVDELGRRRSARDTRLVAAGVCRSFKIRPDFIDPMIVARATNSDPPGRGQIHRRQAQSAENRFCASRNRPCRRKRRSPNLIRSSCLRLPFEPINQMDSGEGWTPAGRRMNISTAGGFQSS